MQRKLTTGKWASILSLTIFFLFLTILPAIAQSGFSVIIYPPDISAFPNISLYVDAFDLQGRFIPGLDLNSFSIIEDGIEMPVNDTQLLEPGLHTIVAFNLGATLSNRSSATVPTRYESAVFDVASWLNGLSSSGTNQYSLTSNDGILVEKLQEKSAYTLQLQNYKPNLFNFEPDLTSLNLALDIAAKPNLIQQSKQSILYITPLPLDSDLPAITALRARAQDLRVPVNVWLMAPDTAANSPAAIALSQLASTTGGKFLLYTEETPLPDPEAYVGLLRNIYQLRYTSNASQSGAHTVSVKTRYENQDVISQETPFSIDLTIPSAVLVNLPNRIDRTFANTSNGRELQPTFVTLQGEVIFPDGYSRQLEATRLYVDGQVVAEITREPFNFFPWPLETYKVSGEHLVSIEVEDILGFRSISSPKPVYIYVESLYPQWLARFLKFFNAGGWIAFAILGLGSAIFAGIGIQRSVQQRASRSGKRTNGLTTIDPLLQSVPGLASNDREIQDDRFRRPVYTTADELKPKPYFKQIGISPFEVASDLSITPAIKIIGSEKESTTIHLDHPSVSPQHAQVRITPTGSVGIADMRSSTGTWVNYAPISTKGTILKDGDLVKIGMFTFHYYLGLSSEDGS